MGHKKHMNDTANLMYKETILTLQKHAQWQNAFKTATEFHNLSQDNAHTLKDHTFDLLGLVRSSLLDHHEL